MKEVWTYVLTLLQEIVHVYTKRDEENPYFHLLDREDIYVVSPHELLKPLRMIKTEEEILYIWKAISITHMAYEKIRTLIKPKMSEFEIEALIAGTFRSQHTTEAYPTIVASGKNACTLHYTAHTSIIEDGDMVLIDFWAEYHGYASDITRVFPVWETSERQKEVYTSVIAVKDYAESLIRPGVKKSDYELMVREKMNEELQKLGLISEGISRETRETLSRQYFPHSVSHFLGLDVHDIWERDTLFEKWMVITCEPGIYIPLEGIGIRLEDDILITENGRENLSKNISLS